MNTIMIPHVCVFSEVMCRYFGNANWFSIIIDNALLYSYMCL